MRDNYSNFLPLRISVFASLLLAFSFAFTNAQTTQFINPEDVTIVRDQWGVPHIYGETDEDVAYGLSWARSEDDFKNTQIPFCAIKGKAGSVIGLEGAIFDVIAFIGNFDEIIEKDFDTAFSPKFRKVLAANVQAVNDYARTHPKEVLVKDIFPVTEKDVIKTYLMGGVLMSNAVLDIAKILKDEMNSELSKALVPKGSNGWAFSKDRTEEGQTWMVSNSHQPLEGFLSWYEAHVHSDEGWNMLGATFSTGVSLFLGTNENLGWTHCVNWPDLADVYEMEMNPDKKNQYKFDGEWLELEERKIKFKVKVGPIKVPVSKTFYWSKHGAVMKNKEGYFAVRMPATLEIKSAEQWYRMNKAQNFTEFKEALDIQGISSLNVVYADKEDNIFYLSNGLFPERDEKYDWEGVLEGNTSDNLWDAKFQPIENLPQVENPSCGYVFNTNNTPFTATGGDDNVPVESIDPTMSFLTKQNNRSLRFMELIAPFDRDSKKISFEDFKKIKFDHQYCSSSFYTYSFENFDDLVNMDYEKYPDLKDVFDLVKDWDRKSNVENPNAAVVSMAVYYMVKYLEKRMRLADVNYFPEELFVEALRKSKKHIKKHFGRLDIPLGELQRHHRGDVEYPMQGMPENLAAMAYTEHEKGRLKAAHGESYIQITRYSENGVESIETIVPYGASSHEDSPHYTDQMEMYVNQELKKMTLDKEEIFKNAERVYHPGE